MRADLHASPAPRDLSSTVYARQELNFTLSPSTRLLFTAQADAGVEQQGMLQSYAIATLEGYLSSEINGVYGYEQFMSTLDRRTGSGSEFLRGALDTGTGVGTGTLSASTYTSFTHFTSAVPEPETYGMLLAGLLVVGGIARRNRRAHSRQTRQA
ncbi:PEP-CTERM sorting domain-containing protein [Massilia sp. CCM 8733]|uniref:PEP-CTERM sorting domain-containing protein n=2 Tax=Massilia mucilaginosa TaxID=2609282 RepID=A0ABX0NYN9_9BURK|nr:PEP-CTERM sorting domain-containing protein [Massilia mucilaginosa]